jgi:Tol biopolymer transport system component
MKNIFSLIFRQALNCFCFILIFSVCTNAAPLDKNSGTNNISEATENISVNDSVYFKIQNLIKGKLKIINLGPKVNGPGVEYAPTISSDGKTLYYISNRDGSIMNEGKNTHDYWATKRANESDYSFSEPYNINTIPENADLGINTTYHEGAGSISGDCKFLYMTGCNRPDCIGSCDIFKVSLEGKEKRYHFNLGTNVNSSEWDVQPSITFNGDRIYFVSNRPGPNGNDNMDIWYSDWDPEQEEFKPAQNLSVINTSGKEWSPFICSDGLTLLFSSDSYEPNYGGLDYYVTHYNPEEGTWSMPLNLGEDINTNLDEAFISMPASCDIFYFSSTRDDTDHQGYYDIYVAVPEK